MVNFKEQFKYKITKYLTRLDKAILIDNYNSTLKYSLHLKYHIQKGGVDKYDFTTLDSIITTLQEPQYDLENKIKQVKLQKNIIENEKKTLESDIKKLENEKINLESDKKKLESQKINLENQKINLENEKTTLESDKKKLENQKINLESEKTTLETKINDKINALKKQGIKIKSLQDEIIKSNKQLEEKNKKTLELKNKALEAKDKALENYKNQIISLNNDIKILVQQKESLKKNSENITQKFPGSNTDASITKVKIKEHYEEMRNQLKDLIARY